MNATTPDEYQMLKAKLASGQSMTVTRESASYESVKGKVFISGPMTGIPKFNFPEFDAAADFFRAQGFIVVNPADLSRRAGVNINALPDDYDWKDYSVLGIDYETLLNASVQSLSDCDMIYMLRGWESSRGAKEERRVAQEMRLDIQYQPEPVSEPDPSFPCGIESLVCQDISERQRVGYAKYGTTVADNPLGRVQWLQHAYEEAIDMAVYLRRLIEHEKRAG